MAHISQPLKYDLGHLAFDLATIKELPEVYPFPVEVQAVTARGKGAVSWQGEAWQVIISMGELECCGPPQKWVRFRTHPEFGKVAS
jgi:hypothetical protein